MCLTRARPQKLALQEKFETEVKLKAASDHAAALEQHVAQVGGAGRKLQGRGPHAGPACASAVSRGSPLRRSCPRIT